MTSDSDPYLTDHVVQGEQILPGVMGLEAIAQVAMALAEQDQPPVFEQVEFLQPLVGNQQEKVTLRIAALMQAENTVDVVIRCSKTNFLSNHFRARCVFAEYSEDVDNAVTVEPALTPVAISPEQDLYGDLFFHTGRFVRVSAYQYIDAWQCRAEIKSGQGENWFSRYLPGKIVLGDPGSRDAALHALQVCIPHTTIIPVAIEQIQLLDADCQGPWTLHARERSHADDVFIYDLQLIGKNGKQREIWRGVKLKNIAAKQHRQWPDALLPVYLERQLEAINQGDKIHVALLRSADLDRKQRGIRAIQNALGSEQDVYYASTGKPEVNGYHVSVAHNDDLSLAVSGTETVSCDIERITERKSDFWRAALGEAGINLADQLMQLSDTEHYDFAMTRLWTVFECLKKAGLPLDTPLLVQSFAEDGWAIIEAGRFRIGSTIASFRKTDGEFAVAVLFSQGEVDNESL